MSALSRDSWPSSVRSDSRLAAMVGYGLALVAFGLTIGGDSGTSVDLAGAVAVTTVLAVPPTLALMADPRRPLLLLPAALIAVSSPFVLSVFALPMVAAGLGWLWVYSKVAPRGRVVRKLTVTLLVWVLWVPAVAALFVHADPRCTSEPGLFECTSDVVVWWETLVALSSAGGAVLTGWFLSSPPAPVATVQIREPMNPTRG